MQSPNSAKLILVANKDTDILTCLEAALPRKGYSVVHASNGEETLALIRELDSQMELMIVELELSLPCGLQSMVSLAAACEVAFVI